MNDIFQTIVDICAQGKRAALATLIQSKGSIPMSQRARMLVKEDGNTVGTIGGGCLEAEGWSVAKEVLETGKPQIFEFVLTEKQAGESGLICGGNVRIFIEPVQAKLTADIYQEILRLQSQDQPVVLASVIAMGGAAFPDATHKMLIHSDETTMGSLGHPWVDHSTVARAREALRTDRPEILCLEPTDTNVLARYGSPLEVFIDPVLPAPKIFLFGAGHVSYQVSKVAKMAGFKVVVIDDRPLFANRQRFPEADVVIVDEFDSVFGHLDIDEHSYILAITRGHQHDEVIVAQAIKTPAKYIGMIGSQRKALVLYKRMESRGVPRALLEQIHSPIGLDIGADTPGEIAVSIVAELIRVRRRGKQTEQSRQAPSSKKRHCKQLSINNYQFSIDPLPPPGLH